jgi:hypothetical protein
MKLHGEGQGGRLSAIPRFIRREREAVKVVALPKKRDPAQVDRVDNVKVILCSTCDTRLPVGLHRHRRVAPCSRHGGAGRLRGGPAPLMRQGTGGASPFLEAETAARCGVRGASFRGRSVRMGPEMKARRPSTSRAPGSPSRETITPVPVGRGPGALANSIGSSAHASTSRGGRSDPSARSPPESCLRRFGQADGPDGSDRA